MKNKTPIFLIILVIISFVVFVSVGIIAWKTNGTYRFYQQKESKLFARIGDTELTEDSRLKGSSALRIDVHGDYTVKVIGKSNVRFDFKVDDELVGFEYIDDFTQAFNVKTYDGYFTINTLNRSLLEIIQIIFSGKTISNLPILDRCLFTLQIKGKNGHLNIDLIGIAYHTNSEPGVELDHTEIIF